MSALEWGTLLLRHRTDRGMSIYALAKVTGYSHSNLSNMESGKRGVPEPRTVRLIADGLGLRGAERDAFFAKAAEIVARAYREESEKPPMVRRVVMVEEVVS